MPEEVQPVLLDPVVTYGVIAVLLVFKLLLHLRTISVVCGLIETKLPNDLDPALVVSHE